MAPAVKYSFEDRIQHLLDYEADNGHMFVPQGYTGHGNLGRFVANTRMRKKSTKPELVAQLDEIGFSWVFPKGSTKDELIQWGKQFKMLVKFHKTKGHCNVPKNVGGKPYPLATWCEEQREQFGGDRLDQDKIDKLTRLNFDFFGSSEEADDKPVSKPAYLTKALQTKLIP